MAKKKETASSKVRRQGTIETVPPAKKTKKSVEIEFQQVSRGHITFHVVGTTPMICNRMPEKVKRGLLLPPVKKNAAEKASTLKHDPRAEFRSSPHTRPDGPTLIVMPTLAFKSALRSAALDLPGSTKSQIGRLTFIEGRFINIYGVPKLYMDVVRNSDIGRTPDIRTRAMIEEWCAELTVVFTTPLLKEPAIANLMLAAGINIGVGDFRPEKGAGNYGQFMVVPATDRRYKAIVKQGGRKDQVAAMKLAEPIDDDSGDLLQWFDEESAKRGFKPEK